jgi:hypothetical protein
VSVHSVACSQAAIFISIGGPQAHQNSSQNRA